MSVGKMSKREDDNTNECKEITLTGCSPRPSDKRQQHGAHEKAVVLGGESNPSGWSV